MNEHQLTDLTLRTRVIPVDLNVIASLLRLDGRMIIEVEGWPEGSVVMGASVEKLPSNKDVTLMVAVYNKDFPPNLSMGTPTIPLIFHARPLAVAQAELVAETSEVTNDD